MPFTFEGEWIPHKKIYPPLKVYLEKRRGAFVTIIKNLPLEGEEVKEFTSQLKKYLATGGSFKENLVEIQGDHLEKVNLFLKSKGFI